MIPPQTCKGHSDKPNALSVQVAAIPDELKQLPRWIVWRYTWRKPKWTKPPVNARTGQNASVSDPETWSTFEQALHAYQHKKFDGLGFVLHLEDDDEHGIVAVDLDHCRDPQTGAVQAWAQEILEDFKSYSEASPSGCGFRILCRGHLPPGGNKKGDFELFETAKYNTITGNRLENLPETIETRQEQIDRWHAHYFPPETPPPNNHQESHYAGDDDDDELIRKASRAKNGTKFESLWAGSIVGYASHSEADLALCAILCFWARYPDRVDRLFRRSGLMREKWDAQRGEESYGARTIRKALSGKTDFYTPPVPPSENGSPSGPCTGYDLILADFKTRYQPIFRTGTSLFSQTLGREVRLGEACCAPAIDLVERLLTATDAPRDRKGINRDLVPKFFWTWAKSAWRDLLDTLPEEEEGEEVAELAGEEFRKAVAAALFTLITLQVTFEKDGEVRNERRTLLDWCRLFAKADRWGDVRSHQIWCRLVNGQLRIALRHELFGQLPKSGELAAMSPCKFARLCQRYEVGSSERANGQRVVELLPAFVESLNTCVEEILDVDT
jgi:hypothetical protein